MWGVHRFLLHCLSGGDAAFVSEACNVVAKRMGQGCILGEEIGVLGADVGRQDVNDAVWPNAAACLPVNVIRRKAASVLESLECRNKRYEWRVEETVEDQPVIFAGD